MKSEIIKKTETQVTFRVTVDEQDIKHALKHTYDKYRDRVKAAGFRPGKAPDNIVAREIGDNVIQSETVEHTIGHAYADVVEQEKLSVIASPDVQVKKWVPYTELEFEATVEVVPPVKLPDYKKIKKKPKEIKVSDDQISEVIEDLRRRIGKRVPALRAAGVGDEVRIDFEGSKDGKPVEGAAGQNYNLKLGSNTFIPGFEDEVVGLKVDDEKTFKVTFPADYHEKTLAGQPIEFKIKVHEISSLELPEVDDKFASEVGPFKTVDDLRNDITDQLKMEAEENAKREYENELLEDILKKTDAKTPEKLVVQQTERLKGEMEQRLASSGLTMDQYLQSQKRTQEEFEKEMRPEAEKRVKLALVLSEISKAEDLKVTEDEIEAELEGLRMRYTDPQMQHQLTGPKIKEDIYNHLMATKTIGKLVEYAQR